MRHKIINKKFNRNSKHRKHMIRNLLISLIKYENIKISVKKAKYIKRFIEPIITKCKNYSLSNFRFILNKIKDKDLTYKLFNNLGPKYINRPGGYTQIFRYGYRKGDNTEMCFIKFV